MHYKGSYIVFILKTIWILFNFKRKRLNNLRDFALNTHKVIFAACFKRSGSSPDSYREVRRLKG